MLAGQSGVVELKRVRKMLLVWMNLGMWSSCMSCNMMPFYCTDSIDFNRTDGKNERSFFFLFGLF